MRDQFSELTITALREGGFVVSNMFRAYQQDRPFVPVFACSTLDEALKFIRASLVDPTPPQREESKGA